MERILVIGCPGSGKSQCSKKLKELLHYPLLHLDRIYHIDNKSQISKEELKLKILDFINKNKTFIIDGNYSNTLETRMIYADTIIFFHIEKSVCLSNAINRTTQNAIRDDIAPGFDNTIIDPEFISYIENFEKIVTPRIDKILETFKGNVIKINNYKELDLFYNSIT